MRNTARVPLVLSLLLLGAFGAAHAHAAAGDLDRSFGKGGKALRDVGGSDHVADVVTQSDRKVLAVVQLERGGDPAVAVMRLRRNGRLDRRFGDDGVAVVNLAGNEYAGGIALQPNGRIVVSFTLLPGAADSAFGIARFKPNGNPDRSFDRDGVQTTGFGTGISDATAHDVALTSDGDIVAAGLVYAGDVRGYDFAVARFDSDGDLDSGFSGDGRQATDFNEDWDRAWGVAVDSEDRILVVGSADELGDVDPLAVARYDTDGELDSSFSDDGLLVSMLAPEGRAVVALPDDRIAVAGTVSGDYLVARFAEDGTPDTSFSGDGAETVDFVDGADQATSLALAGQKLVVAGIARTAVRGRDFGVARLTATGQLDRSFSDDGRRAIDLAKGEDTALGIAVDRTGDVVVGGWAKRGRGLDTGIVRLQGKGGR